MTPREEVQGDGEHEEGRAKRGPGYSAGGNGRRWHVPDDKPVWEIDTKRLADCIERAVARARTEEDVKMAVEPLLRDALRDAGIDVEVAQYEKSVASTALRAKRMDVVYGFLILEYKAPGRLSKVKDRHDAVTQVEGYLGDEARRSGGEPEAFLEKAVGVCIDGRSILFVRYSRTARILYLPAPIRVGQGMMFPELVPQVGFQVQGPFPVAADSLANLLVYARSAARRRLTAEELARVFGPEQDVARTAVSELYTAAMRGQRRGRRVATFFAEWDRIFGVVYGEAMEAATAATEEAAKAYRVPSGARAKPLIFAIHTYYALLMKLMAVELAALQRDIGVSPFVAGLGAVDSPLLRDRLASLESGLEFRTMGIDNFLEADFFSWYLDVWDESLANAIRAVVRALAEFEPATPVLAPDWTRDLLQNLYEFIVPRALRHDLGEYYTPDWLASHVVDLSGYDGEPSRRVLDPACGSGTFLVQAIRRALGWMEKQKKVDAKAAARSVLDNVVGFDLNPLAVLAARTNYLIAFAPLLPYVRPISLPVYLCDSVVPPNREQVPDGELAFKDDVVFRTKEHDFVFPLSIRDRGRIDAFTGDVMTALRSKLDPAIFRRSLAKRMSLTTEEADRLAVYLTTEEADRLAVYRTIKTLDDEGRDGIWAHYIKNAFAPVYLGRFDYVVGNPPWIRWGYLSAEYRARTLPMWHRYGLFSLKGHEARLGQGEKDFSMLFTYACADRYVRDDGVLAFVITYEVFKSKGAGEGFRRFRIGDDGPDLAVDFVEDMVHLQPFHAANKTCVFRMRRGRATQYPVRVVEWRRNAGVGKIPPEWSEDAVLGGTTRRELVASPVDGARLVSSWQTSGADEVAAREVLKGRNPYRAVLGVRAEPYGVFWLRVVSTRPDGRIVVENLHDRGKRKITPTATAIEPDLVYPAVAGGNLTRYGVHDRVYILLSQDPDRREPFPEEWMLDNVPLTHAYLSNFRDVLLSRGSRVVRELAQKTEFYAMYAVSAASLAPFRVTWKRMASRVEAVVLSNVATPFGPKAMISTDTTSFIPTDDAEEAHYLCAVLNSAPVDSYIRSFSSAGRGFGAPSVMQNIAIPRFDKRKRVHRLLADLSRRAHEAVAKGEDADDIQAQIDATVRELWNID